MAVTLNEFRRFPAEREAIGNMLMVYGEIEFAILGCLGDVLDGDLNTAARILFRVKGESARIDVADAIIRPAFQKNDLEKKWENTIGAIHFCRRIRNQYAHCHWQLWEDKIRFLNFDRDVRTPSGELILKLHRIDGALLKAQSIFFEYTLDWLYFLEKEHQKRLGKIVSHSIEQPKMMAAPALYLAEQALPSPAHPRVAGR